MKTDRFLDNKEGELWQHEPRLEVHHVSLLFSLVTFGVLFIDFRQQQKDLWSGLVATQMIVALLPIILLIILKVNIPDTMRLNPIKPSNVFLIMCMMPFALFTVAFINIPYLIYIEKTFGKTLETPLPIPETAGSFLFMLAIIGITAGICEEVLFRGVILRGFEGAGIVPAILISSVLFGLMHFDFQKLLATTLLGIIIGFIVYRTNSVFAGMIAHFMNNATALVFTFIAGKIQLANSNTSGQIAETLQNIDLQNIAALPASEKTYQSIIFLTVFGLILFVLPFISLLRALIRNTQDVRRKKVAKQKLFPGILGLIPGLVLVGFIYIALVAALLEIEFPAVKLLTAILF